NGQYSIAVEKGKALLFNFMGYETKRIQVETTQILDVSLIPDRQRLDEIVVVDYGTHEKAAVTGGVATSGLRTLSPRRYTSQVYITPPMNTESYTELTENKFYNPLDQPLSTFAVDVDAA